MLQLPRVIKAFNLYVDGIGYAGKVDSATPPALALVMEEHRAAGMDMPKKLDMGMEAMTMTAVVSDYGPELRRLFGRDGVQFQLRKAAQAQGQRVEPVMLSLRGQITRIEDGEVGGGSKTTATVTFELDYFKYRQREVDHITIDVVNMIRQIGDEDQLADQRDAIAL